MTVDSSPGALNIEHYYMTFELCDNISPIFQSQVVILSSPGGDYESRLFQEHSTFNNDQPVIIFHSQRVITNSPGAQWQLALSGGHSGLNNLMSNWWCWVPLGHNESRLCPRGTQHWTIWPVHWWWYFIANCWYWVPLGHNESRLPGGTQPRTISPVHLSYFIANWWYWFPVGHNESRAFPGGTQHFTIWCLPVIILQGQLLILNSPVAQWEWTIPRGHSTFNNMASPRVMVFHIQLEMFSFSGV